MSDRTGRASCRRSIRQASRGTLGHTNRDGFSLRDRACPGRPRIQWSSGRRDYHAASTIRSSPALSTTAGKDQLRDEVKQQNPKDPDAAYAEREKDILRDLIDQQLLIEKGKDLDITGDTDLIKQLDQMRKDMKLDSLEELEKEATKQGVSWGDFKQTQLNQIITRKVIGQEVSAHLSVSKDEEQKFYDEHKGEMEQPEFIRLSEILVAPKAAAPTPRQPLTQPPRQVQLRRPMIPHTKPPTTPPSAPPKPRPTISSSRFMAEPVSKISPRNIPTAPRPPMAAHSACSSAANSPKNSKTELSP